MKNKITKEVLIEKLKELQKAGDIEGAHGEADDLLLQYIGDKEITREFKKIERWYA